MRWRRGWLRGVLRAARRVRGAGLRGWVELERDTILQIAKSALAAAVAWWVAESVFGSTRPALASLAAIIVVQVTVYQSVAQAVQFVAGVVVGLLIALGLAQLLGVTAWSIGLVMFASLVIGRSLRLGGQANQVAISALLVLSAGTEFGQERVWDTLIGAGVGVLTNLLVLPPTHVAAAGRTLRGVAEDIGQLCEDVGRRLPGRWGYAEAQDWLGQARDIDDDLRGADEALEQGDESVRYNPRRRAEAEALGRHREALRALHHVTVQVRGILRTLNDLAREAEEAQGGDVPADWQRQARPVLAALGQTLREARQAARSFGSLQTDEPHQWEAERQALRTALGNAEDMLDTATAQLRVLPPGRMQRMLTSTLVDAERMLTELDPEGQHTAALPRRDQLPES